LYSPGGDSFDLCSPGYFFLATDTPGVLQWLAQRARVRGVHVRFDEPLKDLERSDDRWLIRPAGLSTRWVVGADGAKSTVARRTNLGINRRFLVGVEAEFVNVNGVDGDFLHVYVDSKLAPGYIAWVVPGVGQTQIGLACNANQAPQLEQFLGRLQSQFDLTRVDSGRWLRAADVARRSLAHWRRRRHGEPIDGGRNLYCASIWAHSRRGLGGPYAARGAEPTSSACA
jgi:2-polyprenyl-6-methoxyphenol hydroxylase-like FAD-dependent oxidoreductase